MKPTKFTVRLRLEKDDLHDADDKKMTAWVKEIYSTSMVAQKERNSTFRDPERYAGLIDIPDGFADLLEQMHQETESLVNNAHDSLRMVSDSQYWYLSFDIMNGKPSYDTKNENGLRSFLRQDVELEILSAVETNAIDRAHKLLFDQSSDKLMVQAKRMLQFFKAIRSAFNKIDSVHGSPIFTIKGE